MTDVTTLTAGQLEAIRQIETGGARVRAARRAIGLTQVDLAARLGITQSRLSAIECRTYSDVTVETARAFSTFFGCAIEDLFPVPGPNDAPAQHEAAS